MRQVLSLSLPARTAQKIKRFSKQRGFDSVSGYVKHLIALDEDLISEKELLQSIKDARLEYKKGKTVTARSLADFL